MDNSDDIVTRLRDTRRAGYFVFFVRVERKLLDEAADEIERLRKERDEAEPLLNELWERRMESSEMRAEIERLRVIVQGWEHSARNAERDMATLRAERDEVRQSYCSLMEAYRGGDGRVTANKLGWGYLFEEDTDGR